jgi:hypothetical protein
MKPSTRHYTGRTERMSWATKRFFQYVAADGEVVGSGYDFAYESPEQERAHAKQLHQAYAVIEPSKTLGDWITTVKGNGRARAYI